MSPDLWLELGAKFTIVASLLIVIYFFTFTTWRITRLPNNGWPLFHLSGWGARQELHQRATSLPFTFTLCDSSLNQPDSFSFRLCATSQAYSIKALWGVDASYVFKLINHSSWECVKELEDTPLISPVVAVQTILPYENPIQTPEFGWEYNLTITSPRQMDWTLLNGQYKYPLALFFQSNDTSLTGDSESVLGLCVILHVKNPIIQQSTGILAQYIKLSNGFAHKLQPLYVMDVGEPEVDQSGIALESEPFGAVVCSVCQTLPVSRAIVPCGHVCLCAQCFGKVGNFCPICRGPINYFFKTRNENYHQLPS